MNRITFNDILKEHGIAPNQTYLVRQADSDLKDGKTMYDLWCNEREMYKRYSQLYKDKKFEIDDYIAFFVPNESDSLRNTTFIGLAKVVNIKPRDKNEKLLCLPEMRDNAEYDYEFEYDERFEKHVEKLLIDWGGAYRKWCQKADENPKLIL